MSKGHCPCSVPNWLIRTAPYQVRSWTPEDGETVCGRFCVWDPCVNELHRLLWIYKHLDPFVSRAGNTMHKHSSRWRHDREFRGRWILEHIRCAATLTLAAHPHICWLVATIQAEVAKGRRSRYHVFITFEEGTNHSLPQDACNNSVWT